MIDKGLHFYRLIIAYDGTNYEGWHKQPHHRTVVDTLYLVFKKTFNCEGHLVGASRTDAGVHALGQVALLKAPIFVDPVILKKVWNDKLPSDIIIRTIEKVDAFFHPQKDVKQKIYWYHIFPERPLPFISRYGLYYPRSFDYVKLQEALSVFKGKHDFRSFCSSSYDKDTVRTVDDLHLSYIKRYNIYRIEIRGERFLYNMIRRIVGASLSVASRIPLGTKDLYHALAAKNPEQTLPKASAQGLLLYKIMYKN